MALRERYQRAKARLLADAMICHENRALFAQFFDFEEYKLKRQNRLMELDEACYKTLYSYVVKFRNVNTWFNNKPWSGLTREEIKAVYDALEDGTIRNSRGKPFQDRTSYYNKVFKSKPFRIAGKADLAKEVIEFSSGQPREVRFVTEEAFRTMVSVLSKPHHLFLFWLAWDIGENIGALLQLTGRDFVRQPNRYTQEPEYLVVLPREKLKRSRVPRGEPTLYHETVRYADMVLSTLRPDEPIFRIGHRQALKLMQNVVRKTGASRMPDNLPPTWKDLRSGMACHLLKHGWTHEEVNARLGHVPHSRALDAYINYLALDRDAPKKRLWENQLERLQRELSEAKLRQRLSPGNTQGEEENEALRAELRQTKQGLEDLRHLVTQVITMLDPNLQIVTVAKANQSKPFE